MYLLYRQGAANVWRSARKEHCTVFIEEKAESSQQPSLQEPRHTEVQPTVGLRTQKDAEQNKRWLVGDRENITVAPRCRQIVFRLESE